MFCLFVNFFLLFSSQLLHLFNQLKQEILQSHIMEKSFVLIQELLTAAQKSFNLKKYFWKVTKNNNEWNCDALWSVFHNKGKNDSYAPLLKLARQK